MDGKHWHLDGEGSQERNEQPRLKLGAKRLRRKFLEV